MSCDCQACRCLTTPPAPAPYAGLPLVTQTVELETRDAAETSEDTDAQDH